MHYTRYDAAMCSTLVTCLHRYALGLSLSSCKVCNRKSIHVGLCISGKVKILPNFISNRPKGKFIPTLFILYLIVIGGIFLRVVICVWRCDFVRLELVLRRLIWNSILDHIDQ